MENSGNPTKKPLKLKFLTQNPNEKVYYLLRKDFVTNYPWIILLALLLIAPLLLLFNSEAPPFWTTIPENRRFLTILFWYLACIGFGPIRFAKWYYHVFLITNTRVLDVDLIGFLYRNVAEAQLKHIQDVAHTQGGLLQLMFNYGNVYVQTAATRQDIELTNVPNPGKIHDIITDLAAEATSSPPV